jgi:acetyl esterase
MILSTLSRRPLVSVASAGLSLGVLGSLLFTPVPGALLVRAVFNRDSRRTAGALNEAAPDVDQRLGIRYHPGDRDAFLDIYTPHGVTDRLPTIVWTHGGAWLSGARRDYAGYFRRLAAAGFTVAAPGYSLAPDHRYPRALHQLNDAHAHLLAHAAEFNVDTDRIVLAGDSAGAQLSAQLATAVTDPGYAAELEITPALAVGQLRGLILNCGIYDVPAMNSSGGLVGWGVRQALWAYTGSRDFASSVAAAQMSVLHRVGVDFPDTWISGGNADPLTATQSRPLAEKLRRLDVDVETVFYPEDHLPALGHEYQFKLETTAAEDALQSMLDFARRVTQ